MASAKMPVAAPDPSEVAAIAAIPDSAIRNLRITECYHRLSTAMAARTGSGANWCTFATWASKQAGQTIRGEDLFQRLQTRAGEDWSLLHPVQSVWRALLRRGIFNPSTRVGRIVKTLHSPFDAFERASDAVARGNRKVFEEIGYEFARYLKTCDAAVPVASETFATFLNGLKSGAPPEGQQLLREAFTLYQQHGFEPSASTRAQLLLLANLKIGLHEQTRLQPEIQEAIESAPDTAKDLRERVHRALIPHRILRRVLRGPIEFAARRYAEFARALTRKIVTDSLMVLVMPDQALRLGAHLPLPFAPDVERLDFAALRAMWDEHEPNKPDCADCGALDWASLPQRMHYIMHLFRCYHAQNALFTPPFSPDQRDLLLAGKLPSGSL